MSISIPPTPVGHTNATARATPAVWSVRSLRAAAVVFALYAFGHTYGGMLHDPDRGPRQAIVLSAMRDYLFVVQGQMRSYWNFYRGFGFFVSMSLVLLAVLCWQLGSLARSNPRHARPLVATLFVMLIPMTVLTWIDFFPAPGSFSTVATALLGVALIGTSRASAAVMEGGR